MRKPLFILLFLSTSAISHAQNLSIFDLTNLAKMNNASAHDFLSTSRLFRQFLTEQVNGLTLDHYRYNNKNGTKETIIVGDGDKANSGVFLRTVSYTSADTKYITSLIVQAGKAGLKKRFAGADATKKIYLLDNSLYSVHFYLNNDNASGTVVVRQKEYIPRY